jgi:adenylate kinase family enzyme
MNLVFLGPPGAGKGTQSQRLIAHLDANHVSTGDILRNVVRSGGAEGKEVEQYLAAGHDIVVLGHFHVERLLRMTVAGDERRIFVLPEWKGSRRHLEIRPDGQAQMVSSG